MADLDFLKANVFPGESGGDYNALFGYANRPGGQFAGINLSDMTIDQALAFADPKGPYAQSVKNQIGRVATPMGAYQIVGTTLRAAKEGLGLTGNERMTPAMQDQLGMWIYKNQGPGAWVGWGKKGGGGSASTSTSNGGTAMAGLLDMPEQDQGGLVRLLTGENKPWASKMNDIGAVLLALSGSPAAQPLLEMTQRRRERRDEMQNANRTAQWLASRGRPDLAEALMSGAIDARTAASAALAPPEQPNVMEVGGKLVDETGRVVYDPTNGQTPPMSADQLSGLNTLRDDATTATAELGAMGDAWKNIETFYQNPGSVSDRALVIAFAKILDPTSVVRESESAAIANSGSLEAGLKSTLLNTLRGGGNLPPDIRNEIVRLSQQMYSAKIPGAQKRVEMLRETARRAGLPPELIFPGDFSMPGPVTLLPPGTPTTTLPPAGAAPTQTPQISPNAQKYLP